MGQNAITGKSKVHEARHQQMVEHMDKLALVREKAAQVRDLEHEIENLEQRLADKKSELFDLCHIQLPGLMDEIGINSIGIAANGNMPAINAVLRPFYRANIGKTWSEERKAAAFDWLTNNGFGDLIKTEVVMKFPREQFKKAKKILAELSKKKLNPELSQRVHNQTLTAWLREQIEQGHSPPLNLLGAEIGRVVILETKDDEQWPNNQLT